MTTLAHFSALSRRGWLRGLLILLGALIAAPSLAQTPAWQMAQLLSTRTIAGATATDAAGNVYLAGSFVGSATFGTTTLNAQNAADTDVFVAKWSPATGCFVWARRAGGSSSERATALAVNGNQVYVLGTFSSATAAFGNTTLTNSSADGNQADIFVAKLTDAGATADFTWAQAGGGPGLDYATGLALTGNSVYIAGYFEGSTVRFGSTALFNSNPMPSGPATSEVYVAKLADAGSTASFNWAVRIGGQGSEQAFGLAASGSNLYVVGYFDSQSVRYGCTLCISNLISAGGADAFVGKLTDAGTGATFGWVQGIGGSGSEVALAVAAQQDEVYVTGAFSSPTLGLGATTLANSGLSNAFITKLTDNGATMSFRWAEAIGSVGLGITLPQTLRVQGPAVYVAGSFTGATARFGGYSLANSGSIGTDDVFVAGWTDTGASSSVAWVAQAGGVGNDQVFDLALHNTSLFLTGVAILPARFGPLVPAGPAGSQFGFFAQLAAPVLALAPPLPLPGLELYPNPAQHSLTIEVVAPAGPVRLTLGDAQGRVVRPAAVLLPDASGQRYRISLAGLAPGLYLATVQSGSRQIVRRLLVQ
ncbi:T9SS type A sorting domain-containing protein [Hymenobacter aquaticus]|nr:T9SS type A sorting domain-containing protein [Hymenobacter aquaticus]